MESTPFVLPSTPKQIAYARRQLNESGSPMTYQFFFRPAPKTLDAAKGRALSELVAEARSNAKASGKIRSVVIEPTPQTINSGRAASMFGQPSGLLQYELSVVVVFDAE